MTLFVLLVLGAAICFAALPFVTRGSWSVGGVLLCAAVLTLPWNAVRIGVVAVGDVLLLGAAVAVGFEALRRHTPLWFPMSFWTGGLLIAIAGALSFLYPPSPAYMTGRLDPMSALALHGTLESTDLGSNLGNLAKLELALLVVPLIIIAATRTTGILHRLLDVFLLSAVVTSVVAIADAAGLAGINSALVGYDGSAGRTAGLSAHPNTMASNIALAAPVAVLWFGRGGRWRVAAASAATVLVVGVVLTGSRSGVVATVCGTGLAILAASSIRRRTTLLLSAVGLIGVAALVFQGVARSLLVETRLAPGTAAVSDLARMQAAQQGIDDFLQSPFHGLGFSVVTDAHNVPLQLLAAGGLLAFAGFAVYVAGILKLARRASPIVPRSTAWCLYASILTLFAMSLVGNAIFGRYLYVPVALLAAAVHVYSGRSAARGSDGPARPALTGDPGDSRHSVASRSPGSVV